MGKLKPEHPTVRFTAEYLSTMYFMIDNENENEIAEGSDWLRWSEDSREDEKNIPHLSFDEGTKTEKSVSSESFRIRSENPDNKYEAAQ